MFDHDASAPPRLGPAGRVASPCLGHCAVDPATGWCLGCGRAADEIAGWGHAAPARRAAVWQALPGRLAALGATLMRAEAAPDTAAALVAAALARPAARLSLAMPGAALAPCDGPWRVTREGMRLRAASAAATLDWRFGPALRVLRPVGGALPAGLVVLACQTVAGLPPAPGDGCAVAGVAVRTTAQMAGAVDVETVLGPVHLAGPPALAPGLPPLPPACLAIAVLDPAGAWPPRA